MEVLENYKLPVDRSADLGPSPSSLTRWKSLSKEKAANDIKTREEVTGPGRWRGAHGGGEGGRSAQSQSR